MRKKYSVILVALFLTVFGLTAAYAGKDGKDQGVLSSGVEDQTGVGITIYNVNLGLVKDEREIKIPKGTGELLFMDVASSGLRGFCLLII
jgi:hypothetical protein